MSTAAAVARQQVRFVDFESEDWIRTGAPYRWQHNSRLEFCYVPLSALESAGSLRHPDIAQKWRKRMEQGHAIPPLIVSKTARGTYFVHDGNHRLDALWTLYSDDPEISIRVGCVVPRHGYCFRLRHFRTYSTYWLEPVRQPHEVAHCGRYRLPSRSVGRSEELLFLAD